MRGDVVRWSLAAAVAASVVTACGASAKPPPPTVAATASTSASAQGSATSFCSAVQALAHGITPAPTAAGAAEAHARVNALLAAAPPQLHSLVVEMTSQYNAVIDAFAANGYDANRVLAHASPSVIATLRRLASEANGSTPSDPEATVFGYAESHCASPPPTTTAQAVPATTGAPAAVGAPAAIPTAASLVAKAMANALAKQWAHIDDTETSGSHTIVFSDDTGPSSGHQVITVDGAHAETIVVGGVAYAKGDPAAVVNYFGFPSADVVRLAGKWISFQPSDQGFSDVSASVTLASALNDPPLTGPYHIGAVTTVDGQRVVPVSVNVAATDGGPSGTGTLYITPGGATLPVELDLVGSDGSKSQERFGQWGAAVTITAPPAAIPAASLTPSTTV